ncbi:CoA-transferase family III domain-containing protein, partial [Blastocladiella britannica]
PLNGILVVELAGLAPVPFAGMMLADLGATVLRIDRPDNAGSLAPDLLTRGKYAVQLDLKSSARDRARFHTLVRSADVLLDPYRPGVVESLLGLSTTKAADDASIAAIHPKLVLARIAGFPRDGPMSAMAGHDLNYIASAGVLSLFGRAGERPSFPVNLVADFAGGSLMCVAGILAALVARASTGRGRVVDVNMVQGAQYLASFLRAGHASGMFAEPRGHNLLDSGAPQYEAYATSDGHHVTLAALEPQFYARFLSGLETHGLADADQLSVLRGGSMFSDWTTKRQVLTGVFGKHSRETWTSAFDGSDACVVAVRELAEV